MNGTLPPARRNDPAFIGIVRRPFWIGLFYLVCGVGLALMMFILVLPNRDVMSGSDIWLMVTIFAASGFMVLLGLFLLHLNAGKDQNQGR